MIPCTCFSPRPRPSRVRPRHQLLAAAQGSCWAHPWRSRLRADDPSGVAFQLKTVTIPSSLERSAHNHDPMHLLQSKTTSFTRPATTPAIGRCTSQLLGTPLAISLRADDPSGVAFQLKTVTIPSSLERSAHDHAHALASVQDHVLHASGHDTSYWPLHKPAVGHTLGDLAFGLMTPRVLPSSSSP
jgi:hypothetical protein